LTGPNWKKSVSPVMTCYKLVTCEFKWFGLQGRIENFIQKSEQRLFTAFHRYFLINLILNPCLGSIFSRHVFCTIDKWHGLTMEDIRAIEDKTKEELEQKIKQGEVQGMKGDDN
jgi:hypothetical protein